MNESQIKNIIEGYIDNALSGMDKENPKLDFKSKWYDLKKVEDINEFLKDSSAIANTPGLDGFIVIGFDDRKKIFCSAKFSDSNLNDSNELNGMLIRKLDRNFLLANYDIEINGNKLSVLHIPPSFDKPHVIRSYQPKNGNIELHRVFIKNGSSTRIANKYDLDFIAYDRKNHMPEYSLFLSTTKSSIHPKQPSGSTLELNVGLVIENNGYRPVAIAQIILTFYYKDYNLDFISKTNKEEKLNEHILASNLIIQQNEIKNFSGLMFRGESKKPDYDNNAFLKTYHEFNMIQAAVSLNNGKKLHTVVEIVGKEM